MSERLHSDDATAEEQNETTTVEVEIRYVRGAHRRDADALEPGTEAFELTRDLRCFGEETFERRDITVAHALDVAYTALGDPVEVSLDDVAFDATALDRVATHVYHRLQGPRTDSKLPYDGTRTRSATTGDLLIIDGTAVMVESFGFAVLGDLDDLADEPSE